MVIISMMFLLVVLGFILLYLTEILPIFQLMQMEWIAAIVMILPPCIAAVRLGTTKTLKLFEGKPMDKEIIIFIRRDGIIEPMYASRPFHGESFLEASKIGLIHDLGRGSVFRWGKTNIRFVLENVNHTPDPRFANFTRWLYEIGFNNTHEIVAALDGGNGKDKIEELPEAIFDPIDESIDILIDEAIKNGDKKDDNKPKWFKRQN